MRADVVCAFAGKKRRAAFGAAAALCLSSCDLEWEKPDLATPPPETFREAKSASAKPIARGPDFAARFGSKELTALVEQAVGDNLDIAAAVARIQQADAQARVSSAALWPNVAMQDIARRTRTPGTTTNIGSASTGLSPATSTSTTTSSSTGFSAREYNFFQLGLTASYEIDFWGKNEDASYASRLLANASRFNRDTVEISTIAAVLNAYFQVLTAQDRLNIAHNNVAIAERVYRAIQARFEVGVASVLDTAQQETVVAQQRASIPPLEQTLRQTRNQLAVLVGQTPESLSVKGGSLTKLAYPKVAPGLPSEMLLRRPDVANAEAQLASQEFSVLQARAMFFPSITLTGQYGVQTALLHNLLRPEAIGWQIASNLAQPIFDGYNLQGNYEQQKGRYAELGALYKKQILTALSDTENALIASKETAQAVRLQGLAVAAARRALTAAEMRLQEGTIDIVTLSTTQNTLFLAQDQLALARLSYFQSATSLYQALGGGWSPTTRDAEIASANAAYEADKGIHP
ncbi:efflux transporter outer membrane subunit [Methylocystis sp. MJC1]|uniref:efflux transporter outer membrane subunit n=1 Tax=Methylocystis sp. MJC1 TaxID=2654282 RepID=UPI0013ED56E1|nr:efflux transporter outer membrane subunit [Methylocystis sp. MJC1]KAF2990681.1 Outer membrane protein OprM [Methylocystis sp. MJC1]MBU6528718.1 efflux transporter outer membrane subunit [Methylocystis sp. MJC1]UZX11606.1 efflux transporter outer membrane subunit [Methylocystis sp. MJC1]